MVAQPNSAGELAGVKLVNGLRRRGLGWWGSVLVALLLGALPTPARAGLAQMDIMKLGQIDNEVCKRPSRGCASFTTCDALRLAFAPT